MKRQEAKKKMGKIVTDQRRYPKLQPEHLKKPYSGTWAQLTDSTKLNERQPETQPYMFL